MRKSLNLLTAAALVAALGACNRGRTADEEQRALNEAAAMNDDNSVYDTSPDDMALNEADVAAEENAPAAAGNGAAANSAAAAPPTRQ